MQRMGVASGRENFHFYRVFPRAPLLPSSPSRSPFDLKELKYIHDCFEPYFSSHQSVQKNWQLTLKLQDRDLASKIRSGITSSTLGNVTLQDSSTYKASTFQCLYSALEELLPDFKCLSTFSDFKLFLHFFLKLFENFSQEVLVCMVLFPLEKNNCDIPFCNPYFIFVKVHFC